MLPKFPKFDAPPAPATKSLPGIPGIPGAPSWAQAQKASEIASAAKQFKQGGVNLDQLMQMAGLQRQDPTLGYTYALEIDGIACARFMEVKGLTMEVHYKPYGEGGNNGYEKLLFEKRTFTPLTVKKGFYTHGSELYDWAAKIRDGETVEGRSMALIVFDDNGEEACRFNLYGAYITKYTGPVFTAVPKEIAFEEITIKYELFVFKPARDFKMAAAAPKATSSNANNPKY